MGRFKYETPYLPADEQNICKIQVSATPAAEAEILKYGNEGDELLEVVMMGIATTVDAQLEADPLTPESPHLYVLFDVSPAFKGQSPIPFVFSVQVTRTFGKKYNTNDVIGLLMTVEEGRERAAYIHKHHPRTINFDGKLQ